MDRILDCYRVFSFYGEIGLIIQQPHDLHAGVRMFDENWNQLDADDVLGGEMVPGKPNKNIDPVVPKSASDVLEYSKIITKIAKMPFARVDIYATRDGVRIGEVTLFPGSNGCCGRTVFSEEYDVKLGKMWDQALERIEKDSN